jgi:excisionase family DNA binding protein
MYLELLQNNYVTTPEAAKLIGKTADMIAKLCQAGRLPGAEKIGNTWLIPRAAVESYTPGRRGPLTKKERAASEMAGIRGEMES